MEWKVTYPIGWLKTLGGIVQIMDLLRSKEELDIVVLETINSCHYVKQIKKKIIFKKVFFKLKRKFEDDSIFQKKCAHVPFFYLVNVE